MKNDSLEVVSQVTHMDLRDNCLDSLDLSSVSNLETLHCQRNQLGALTLSGFTLRTLNASSNREWSKVLTIPRSFTRCFGAHTSALADAQLLTTVLFIPQDL